MKCYKKIDKYSTSVSLFLKRLMNHNIMNIILDKMALVEWQNRVQKLHKEIKQKYMIDIPYCTLVNFDEDNFGKFLYIFSKQVKFCSKCNNKCYLYFNHRCQNTF